MPGFVLGTAAPYLPVPRLATMFGSRLAFKGALHAGQPALPVRDAPPAWRAPAHVPSSVRRGRPAHTVLEKELPCSYW